MNESLQTAVQSIESRFGVQRSEFRDQISLSVPAEKIVEVCRALRDELGFEMLSGLTGVDYWPEQEPRFHVVYFLHSLKQNIRLGLRVPVSGMKPAVPTIEGIYPSANWYERELWDMFGVRFEGNSDLRRILMPADWEGHPLRKDYPLGYEEVQFTFNVEEVNERKPRPQEQIMQLEQTEQQMEVTLSELKHLVSERAIKGETVLLNMGPQHPSTHGVLRLLLELDGEVVINCIPDIGFLHTGIEKNIEAKTYEKAEVMTDRIDYLNNTGNNLTYCLAVEKLVELDVPPRAQTLRVMIAELERISSHLVWLGTHALDLAAMSVFLYCFMEREKILDIKEMVSGARMMTTYFRPGGLWRDVPVEFESAVRKFIDEFPARIDEYESLLTKNPIFLDRTKGIGVLSPEVALQWDITGPMLRASGVGLDVRKAEPYSGYEQFDFDIPTRTGGDTYARYQVRMEEMRQSLRIIRQALDRLPYGPVRSNNRKFVPPPRSELGYSMEAVIHHFKLWTEGFNAPKGSVYVVTESPRGELGVFLEGNDSPKPYRCYWRTPSFANLQILPLLSKGHLVADLVALIGTIDIILGDVDR